MKLSALMKKGWATRIAGATEATTATLVAKPSGSVAIVANVAVAESQSMTLPIALVEESAVLKWLRYIQETDDEVIAMVLHQCRSDPDALAYFLQRAREMPKPVSEIPGQLHPLN